MTFAPKYNALSAGSTEGRLEVACASATRLAVCLFLNPNH